MERPGATARRKAGREREQESRGYTAYGFVFILFWFDSHRVSYRSHLGTFHSLGHRFNSFLARILPTSLFCTVWFKAVGRQRGVRKSLISCQYNPSCSVTRPEDLMPCISRALKRLRPPLYWAVHMVGESSCPRELTAEVLEESMEEYSCTKAGSARKQTYHWSASTAVMPSDRQL